MSAAHTTTAADRAELPTEWQSTLQSESGKTPLLQPDTPWPRGPAKSASELELLSARDAGARAGEGIGWTRGARWGLSAGFLWGLTAGVIVGDQRLVLQMSAPTGRPRLQTVQTSAPLTAAEINQRVQWVALKNARQLGVAEGRRQGFTQGWRWGALCGVVLGTIAALIGVGLWGSFL